MSVSMSHNLENKIVYVHDGIVLFLDEIKSNDDIKLSVEKKRQFKLAEDIIKQNHKEKIDSGDGYILYESNVYKVYRNGTKTHCIKGEEARKIKRIIKSKLNT